MNEKQRKALDQLAYHAQQKSNSQCGYCNNCIDYSIYKEYGTGHEEICIVKDNWLDEDFARWSDLHIDFKGNMLDNCPKCGTLLENYCECHLKN